MLPRRFILIGLLCFILTMAFVPMIMADTGTAVEPSFPEWFNIIIGLALPLVAQWMLKKFTSSQAKFWSVIGMSVFCGLIGTLVKGIDIKNTVEFSTYIFALSQVSYKAWWKPVFFN